MNEKHILLVGRICGEDFHWDIAPVPNEYEFRRGKFATWQRVSEMDVYKVLTGLCVTLDESPAEILKWLEEFEATATVNGIEFRKAGPLPMPEPPTDGELQEAIDYGSELQELLDGIEDLDFWRKGQW